MSAEEATLDSQMRVEEAQFCYADATTYRTITDSELATARQEYVTALFEYIEVLKDRGRMTGIEDN